MLNEIGMIGPDKSLANVSLLGMRYFFSKIVSGLPLSSALCKIKYFVSAGEDQFFLHS